MQAAFKSFNIYFDKIWVLTLPRLKDRMNSIRTRLQGLDYEFFYGIDKETLDYAPMEQLGWYSQKRYQQYYRKPPVMSKGMLSCSLGHLRMYEAIIRNGYKRTLILEDDALPVIQYLALFPSVMQSVPEDWEVIYMGYEKNEQFGIAQHLKRWAYITWPSHAKLKLSRRIYSNYYPRTISTHIARAGFHDCTHAYAVTIEGAKKLLQLQSPVAFNADNLLAYACATKMINGYISRPKLFNQLTAFDGSLPSLTSD